MHRIKLNGRHFVAFDLETTGLYPARDRIIEIGAVRFSLSGEISRFSTLIDPGIPVSPEASRINGITDDMLKGCPVISEVLPAFEEFIADSILVAHNIGFDAGFLGAAFDMEGRSYPGNLCMDTLNISRKAIKGRPSYSLEKLSAGLGFPIANAHRALDDSDACMKLFLECVRLTPGSGEMTVNEFLKHYGQRPRKLQKTS